MFKIASLFILIMFYIYGCSNHKILKVRQSNAYLFDTHKKCYRISQSLQYPKKIYNKKYLDKKRQSSDFYIQYEPKKLFSNIVDLENNCTIDNTIHIGNIYIFKKNYSDTAQWKDQFFVAIDISYKSNNYKLDNVRFKDYEDTGWLYAFKFPNVNKKNVETIERALVRIFTDIEDAITNNLTLEQRNSKKDKERLETEQLMDKYIKLQKALE